MSSNDYYNQGNSYGGGQSNSYGGGHGQSYGDDDFSSAAHHAQSHHESSEDSSLFSSAISFIKDRQSQGSHHEEIDENEVLSSHQSLYNNEDDGRSHDSKSLGSGAALQALKMFTGGSSSGSSGGMDKNELIGLAMSQAGKLWEQKQSSGNASGDKQSAINNAAEMAMKMYMKSQGGGIGGTGGPGGGASGLMSLASKFL